MSYTYKADCSCAACFLTFLWMRVVLWWNYVCPKHERRFSYRRLDGSAACHMCEQAVRTRQTSKELRREVYLDGLLRKLNP